jgi:membrane protease YdiL (CAAX protease family)
MGSLICFVMVDLLHMDPRLSLAPGTHAGGSDATGPLAWIIVALGAGVHEELVFRVLLLGGVVAFLSGPLKVRRGLAVAVGFIVSSVLFSAAHHIIGGEPFRMGPFVYRVFCGLIFASLYEWRGLAVAVYTHALYDIYVFLLR